MQQQMQIQFANEEIVKRDEYLDKLFLSKDKGPNNN
jgi:hypothetical protein